MLRAPNYHFPGFSSDHWRFKFQWRATLRLSSSCYSSASLALALSLFFFALRMLRLLSYLPAFFSLRPKLLFCRSFNIGVTKKEPSSISFLFKVSFWPAIAWRLTITHFTDIAVISILIFAAFKLHIFRCDKSTCQLCDTIRTRSHHRRSSIEILHSSTRIRNTCRD